MHICPCIYFFSFSSEFFSIYRWQQLKDTHNIPFILNIIIIVAVVVFIIARIK